MTIASNLYASKVFAEHSIASWPLDDDISYISLIPESTRSFDTWTLTNATYVDYLPYPDNPFPDGPFPYSTFSEVTATDPNIVVEAISADLFNIQDLNSDMHTFSINLYAYTDGSVSQYEFGYRYLDPFTGTYMEDTRVVQNSTFSTWVRLSGTFSPPNVDVQIQMVFRITFSGSASPSVVMNGLSISQWSEATSNVSLGIQGQLVSANLQTILGAVYGTPIQEYGISEKDGYILIENNKLLATNYGIPMVYGSDNITRLNASETLPSVVMPSCGMLNESGRYNSYTAEMWLRIENNSTQEKRIWGPLESDYGLYVSRGYLSLVIGDSIGSYFVADWYRPMLVHVTLRENAASVLINGEEVISITFDTESLLLPTIDKDWMGFYCHSNMPIYELDCVSVLPYIIPSQVAKRRFVWGQGVESPETINSAYEGTVAYIDYPFAEYNSNQSYPDLSKWDAAYFENLIVTRQSLSVPDYDLPIIEIGEKTLKNLYFDNKTLNDVEYPAISVSVVSASPSTPITGNVEYTTSVAHGFELNDRITITGAVVDGYNVTGRIISIPSPTTFVIENSETQTTTFVSGLATRINAKLFTFRPNSTWTDQSYILFENLNVITDVVRGVWSVFEIESPTTQEEPLMLFKDINNSGNRLEININGVSVTYKLFKDNLLVQTLGSFDVVVDDHFTIGIDLPRIFDSYGTVIGEFFGNPSAIEMYVGGNGEKTFSGYIYRIGFSNQTNLNEIESHFETNGIATSTDGDLLNDHLGSYTLLPMERYGRFFFDIGVSSYWEEYYPLTFFAGYSSDSYGNISYDVDFLQYNIGYPTTTTIIKDIVTGSWTYEELQEEYALPVVRTYEALDNSLITGYDSYVDLQNKTVSLQSYDFSQSSVRTYITFQRISDGANKPLSDFSNYQSLPSTNVLDVPSYSNQYATRFEIKDKSVIYPPKTIDIKNMAAVIHLDIQVEGIKTNPLNIRKMSLISKSLETNDFNAIGTRFGSKLYPYSKIGMYFDNKKKNPYAIDKESSPYLYLTKNSGIEPLGLREFNVERGISVPINEQQSASKKVSALQLWVKYSENKFPYIPTMLFSLDGANIDIAFNVVSDQSTSRGRIYATDMNSGADYTALNFYQNGIPVINPYIEKNKWTVIGISFQTPISLSNYTGAINLFPSAVFNDIAYYNATSLQDTQSIVYRRWENIDGTPSTPLDWGYWRTVEVPYGKWDNVLKLAETGIYGVSPETLFKSYSGTNRQIVDDGSTLTISQDGTVVFASEMIDVPNGVNTPRMLVTNSPEWTAYTKKPA